MAKTVTIIDTFGFFFRAFYALPQHLSNKDGFPTGLLTGFTNFIASLQKEHESDYIVFAVDSKGDTFRNEIDPNYKANRQAPPEELSMQLPVAIEWIDKMGYKTLGQVGFEADDMIASVVKHAKEKGYNVRVVSHDKDLYQLIDDGKVVVVDAIKKKLMDEAACIEKYGVTPKQFIDYQSILGDSADNVPGVKGIGKVGAEKLLKEYGDLDNIYDNLATIKGANQKKLIESKDNAYMSKQLVTLRDDVFSEFDFEEYRMDVEHPFLNIYDELVKYEQNAILRILKAKNQVSEEHHEKVVQKVNSAKDESVKKLKFKTRLVTDADKLNSILETLKDDTLVAFDTETTGLDYEKDKLVGFSFAINEEEAYYVPFGHYYLGIGEQIDEDDIKEAIKRIFKSRVVGHNIKFDLHFVTRFLGEDLEIYGDSMILAWLINPESALALDKLSETLLSHKMVSFKDTVKKGETFANVELETACKYAAEDALITLKLYKLFLERLKLQNAEHLIQEAQDIEFVFIKTLLGMESEGIKVDSEFLENFLQKVKATLFDLTNKIHELAGSEFNINSTKQLGVVLFEHLGLPVGKKTKTGYSTNEQVLSSLIDSHSIIPLILEYREVYKLFSTYIEPLLKLSRENEDSRIHTSFIQTGTATGRLSSKNPNLQNIPTRTKLGAEVRRAFVAKEGYKLVGIDYSQIELRLLAHFSEDATLVDAFKHDKDIHRQTAVALFGEDEADAKRSIAKTVNFGLLYGMGQKKLSQTLDISTKEAKEIIDRYFETFPSVKSYFRGIVDGAKERGYVETLLGRRRYFDFENAKPMFKAAYERESVNTLFQGTASDLIKLSMNKIDQSIKDKDIDAKMLLQIHDELIFEVAQSDVEVIAAEFKAIMEGIYNLNIPLKASLNIGDNWSELK